MDKFSEVLNALLNRRHPKWHERDTDASLTAQQQKNVVANSGDELFPEGGQQQNYELPATAFPSVGYIQWLSDDQANVVAQLIATHAIPGNTNQSGIEFKGFANIVGELGAVYLEAGDNTGVTQCDFYVFSDGTITANLSAGGVASAAGAQKMTLIAQTTATNVINDILYLLTNTNGTAAQGLGTGINFYIEDAAGNNQQAADLAAQWVSATNGSETAKMLVFLTQGGTLYSYPLGLLKYVAAGNITIGTTETIIFDQTVPANWLAGDNVIRFEFNTNMASGTSRTITWKIYYDDTVMITQALHNTGTSASDAVFRGKVFSTGSNAQKAYFEEQFYNGTSNNYIVHGTAVEDTTTVKNIKVTCQLGGAVTTALAAGITLEFIQATQ